MQQGGYRRWKASFYEGQLYVRPKGNYFVSKSDPYFTMLYPHFYNEFGKKIIPVDLLPICTLPHLLSVLYLDDGSLCIMKRINHTKKAIYLTPHVFLYLQNYPREELLILKEHISLHFGINFKINTRKDGFGHILRLSTVKESLEFLDIVKQASSSCFEMEYKFNWEKRFLLNKKQLQAEYPNYNILSSDSNRWKNFTDEDVTKIVLLKKEGKHDKQIAEELKRSYWSIVYKLREIRKDGHL